MGVGIFKASRIIDTIAKKYSDARAAGFNKQTFNFHGNIHDDQKLSPDIIYNCVVTGVSVVPETKPKM